MNVAPALAQTTPAAGLDGRPPNTTCRAPQRPPQTASVALEPMVQTGFTPTAMVQSPTQASTWYMLNPQGLIYRYQRNGGTLAMAAAFADLRGRVLATFNGQPYAEMGLLGMAIIGVSRRTGFYICTTARQALRAPSSKPVSPGSRVETVGSRWTLLPGKCCFAFHEPLSTTGADSLASDPTACCMPASARAT